jgi:uncharacterized protein (TIGR03435 family)
MARLVGYLRQMWHTTVEDHTGLTGKFDFSLDMDSAVEDQSAARWKSSVSWCSQPKCRSASR